VTRHRDPSSLPGKARLTDLARGFSYPPTPDIAGTVRTRLAAALRQPDATRKAVARLRWAPAAVIVVMILAALLAVPAVRAAVLDFIRVGAVRIFLAPPTVTPTALPTPTGAGAPPIVEAPLTATPGLGPFELPAPTFSLADLDGATTLADARARAGFPVLLPVYPPDLGAPDKVYLQSFGGNIVVMVWLDRKLPDHVRLSLHALGPGVDAFKGQPQAVTRTQVNGQMAVWTQGPYVLVYRGGNADLSQMINGHVLLWTVGEVTYRLETDVTLDEAVKIAESLR
jgi:hypothetical protein